MTAAEVAEFEKNRYFADAVRLRRWDDAAKIPHHPTPPLAHFARYAEQSVLKSRPA
jgi:gamma-butyrobetaine dioxygenase